MAREPVESARKGVVVSPGTEKRVYREYHEAGPQGDCSAVAWPCTPHRGAPPYPAGSIRTMF